jgi:hypothetical protein
MSQELVVHLGLNVPRKSRHFWIFNVEELAAHLDLDVLKLVGYSAEVEENSSIPILRAVPAHK